MVDGMKSYRVSSSCIITTRWVGLSLRGLDIWVDCKTPKIVNVMSMDFK